MSTKIKDHIYESDMSEVMLAKNGASTSNSNDDQPHLDDLTKDRECVCYYVHKNSIVNRTEVETCTYGHFHRSKRRLVRNPKLLDI